MERFEHLDEMERMLLAKGLCLLGVGIAEVVRDKIAERASEVIQGVAALRLLEELTGDFDTPKEVMATAADWAAAYMLVNGQATIGDFVSRLDESQDAYTAVERLESLIKENQWMRETTAT